jgi:hypothetical protein
MERITNIGLTLLAIIMASLFFNVGYLLQPDLGLINDPLYPESEQYGVARSFFMTAVMSIVVAALMIVGIFWRNMASRISLFGGFALFFVTAFGWWKFSVLFYPLLSLAA